jgi:IclR family transcriptional regulator, acetate operon repressor
MLAPQAKLSQEIIMSLTVDKALELLNFFNQSRMRIGLSEFARLAKIDKATAYRLLSALSKHGLVEQEPDSRAYRLGAATLRLARIREASFPAAAIATPILEQLAEQTGETAHASLLAGQTLATIGVVNSRKALHVSMDAGERLPLHATASGIICLAYQPAEDRLRLLRGRLASFTEKTATEHQAVINLAEAAAARGFAESDQGYETGVYGIAAPIFAATGHACGALAVATPTQRVTTEVRANIIKCACNAAMELTRKLGAEPPATYKSLRRRKAA